MEFIWFMKKGITQIASVLVLMLIVNPNSIAQNKAQPYLVDKNVLSGIGIERLKLKDLPEKKFFQTRLFNGENLSVFVLSSESWLNTFDEFNLDEYVYIVNGVSVINSLGKKKESFYNGEFFCIPKGFNGKVEIQAGNQFHCELSVISTRRAKIEKDQIGKDVVKFDPSLISGAHIDLDNSNTFEHELFKGPELTFTLKADKTSYTKKVHGKFDQFIQLMYGQIILTDESGMEHKFQTGDFLVIPKGFKGSWKSLGHDFAKYILVTETSSS